MNTKVVEDLMQKRHEAVRSARDLVESKKEGMSSEDEVRYSKIMSDVDGFQKQIEREQQLEKLERASAERTTQIASAVAAPDRKEEYREFFLGGSMPAEMRNLNAGTGVNGGYLVLPEVMQKELIKFVDDMVWMRKLARVIPLSQAASLTAPTFDTDVSAAAWTAEVPANRTADTAARFGKRKLTPHKLSKLVVISRDLLQVAALNPETIMSEAIARQFAYAEENAFMTGNGSQQPLGVFVPDANGIPVSRDIASTSTTKILFDTLKDAIGNQKEQYRANSAFIMHRNYVTQISKEKDLQNQYLWQPSNVIGNPDLLLGRPVYSSEFAPNNPTTGQYAAIFGDFSFYWIADSSSMSVQRLIEMYAASDEIGYIGRAHVDGAPVLPEAFTRIKLA